MAPTLDKITEGSFMMYSSTVFTEFLGVLFPSCDEVGLIVRGRASASMSNTDRTAALCCDCLVGGVMVILCRGAFFNSGLRTQGFASVTSLAL